MHHFRITYMSNFSMSYRSHWFSLDILTYVPESPIFAPTTASSLESWSDITRFAGSFVCWLFVIAYYIRSGWVLEVAWLVNSNVVPVAWGYRILTS